MDSLCVSNADVASSSSNMLGFRTRALAMAILCFCPPESCAPLSPTKVSNFCVHGTEEFSLLHCQYYNYLIESNTFGSLIMKAYAFASLHAFSISSSVTSVLPYLMFSLIVHPNNTGSCPTMPILSYQQVP